MAKVSVEISVCERGMPIERYSGAPAKAGVRILSEVIFAVRQRLSPNVAILSVRMYKGPAGKVIVTGACKTARACVGTGKGATR